MKICLISSLYGISGGGAGLVVQQLAEGFSARGRDVFVITTGPVKKLKIAELNGIRIFSIPSYNIYPLREKDTHSTIIKILWQLLDIYNPFVASAIQNILRKEAPDLIHIHKMRGFSGVVWPVSANQCPGRVVQTCHDYESMSPIGTLEGKVGDWARRGNWLLWPYQKARTFLSRKVAVVTSPSKFTLNLITSRFLFPLARKEHVSNSHGFTKDQLEQILKNATIEKNKDIHFLYLGRLEPEKGVRELCIAISSIASMYPGVKFSIAGWGSIGNEIRGRFEQISNLVFAGRVDGIEKEQLIMRADAVIIPSIWLEVSGNVVLEAYAYGKPVIASRRGGLTELVEDGVTGWLLDTVTPSSLVDALERFILTPSALSPAACFQAAEKYSLEEMINNYETIYLSL